MASARPLRKSSRMSSPATNLVREIDASSEPPVRARESKRSSLEQWQEPPLRAPQPSFAESDNGALRAGVLEHMMPLGQKPSSKVIQKLKIVPPKPPNTLAGLNGEDIVVSNGHSRTDTASPAEGHSRSESMISEERTMMATSSRQRDVQEEDDDYTPGMAVRATSVRSRQSLPPAPVTPRTQARLNQAHFQKIAQDAILRAESEQKWGVALGIKHLYDDSAQDPNLLDVLDAVLHQRASEKQKKIFHKYIRSGMKELARVVAIRQAAMPPIPTAPQYQPPPPQAAAMSHQTIHPVAPTALISTPTSPTKPTAQPAAAVPSPQASRTDVPATDGAINQATKVAAVNGATPTKVRKTRASRRSGSVSSSSSLSSAKSLDAETFAPTMNDPGHGQEAQNSDADAKARRPNQRSLSSKAAAKGRPQPSASPQLGHFSLFPNSRKHAAQKRPAARDDPDFNQEEQERQQKRQLLEDTFHRKLVYENADLNERTQVRSPAPHPDAAASTAVAAPVIHPLSQSTLQELHSSPQARAGSRTPQSVRLPAATPFPNLRNGVGRKRGRDELDAADSPAPEDPGVASGAISRTGTPKPGARPAKLLKKSARVMVSPNKNKNGGVTAGMARAGGAGLQSSVGNGAEDNSESHENWDSCGACGGNGKLLCCDGCPRSFHFACLDPPEDPDDPPQGEWYCHICHARRSPTVEATRDGLFSTLRIGIHESNPMAFNLPPKVREYYEGVKTGEEGEYEEIGLARTNNESTKNARGGYTEEPDLKKLRDPKGILITCTRCGLSSDGKREIIACDYCPARWHLDCLDPPLAGAPRRNKNGDKPHHSWKCPNHTDQIIGELDRERLMGTAADGSKLASRPVKRRKPKNPRIVDVALRRGFRNNGIIEIDNMSSDEDEFAEKDMLGTVYRLPEHGIRLDFIDRVKRSWYEDEILPGQVRKQPHKHLYGPTAPRPTKVARTTGKTSAAQAASATSLHFRSFREQQAVLNLEQFARQTPELGLSDNKIDRLLNQLIADAPPAVTSSITSDERQVLLNLKELIDRRLPLVGGQDKASQREVNGESSKT